ncbi:nucleoside transporter [Trichosporon asahii var. asahii CBS 8904]|uniref:Nucleoside transporter n=1 Tax=Trichosporon asahii var. asahii (strain CBS 8904) TaxID=1220162 RepID=K1W4U1_TRIAC|nr:nucleoside transporter [Trichosporon asahii var. asahii CBS 8904]
MRFLDKLNARVAQSYFGKYFRLEGSGHRKERKNTTFTNEIRAGLATFFAMAYIISVNASIVSQSGGPCVCPPESMGDLCDSNVEYMQCVQEVKRDIVTATAAISALVTFCMGAFANMPIGLATGMGTNAYFAYTVVGYHGSGLIPYKVALAAVFVEGFVFVGLTWLGIRQWLARAIPASIKLATAVGIGLYLTLIGMTYSAGIGLITGADATPIELAGCHPAMKDPETGLCPSSDKMRNPTLWLGIFCGGVFTVMLMMYRVKGAIIAGILLVSIISWPRNSPVTYFPHTPLGDKMRNPTLWLGIFCGGVFTVMLMMYRVKGAIIAGILLVSIISWPRNSPVTYFPHTPLGDKMRNPTLWLGIFCGGVFTVMLMMYRVKGAIIAGILLVSIISWPRNSPVTYFPHTPLGDKMRNPTLWLGIFCGGVFTVMLMMYRVKGAIIAGILLVSIISWPRNSPVTYFPHTPLGDKMRNPTLWLGIFCGGVFTVMLMMYRVKGAIIAGILLVSIISWPRNSPVTYFPHTPLGDKMRNPTLWLGIFCGGVFTVMLMMYRVKGAIIAGILLVSIISWPRNSPVTYFPHTPLGDKMRNPTLWLGCLNVGVESSSSTCELWADCQADKRRTKTPDVASDASPALGYEAVTTLGSIPKPYVRR